MTKMRKLHESLLLLTLAIICLVVMPLTSTFACARQFGGCFSSHSNNMCNWAISVNPGPPGTGLATVSVFLGQPYYLTYQSTTCANNPDSLYFTGSDIGGVVESQNYRIDPSNAASIVTGLQIGVVYHLTFRICCTANPAAAPSPVGPVKYDIGVVVQLQS